MRSAERLPAHTLQQLPGCGSAKKHLTDTFGATSLAVRIRLHEQQHHGAPKAASTGQGLRRTGDVSTVVMNVTRISWPWKSSTVPTLTPCRLAARSRLRTQIACARDMQMTPMCAAETASWPAGARTWSRSSDCTSSEIASASCTRMTRAARGGACSDARNCSAARRFDAWRTSSSLFVVVPHWPQLGSRGASTCHNLNTAGCCRCSHAGQLHSMAPVMALRGTVYMVQCVPGLSASPTLSL